MDINLSSNFFLECEKSKVQVVTTKSIKNKHYSNNEEVITLEEWLSLCEEKNCYWKDYNLSKSQKMQIKSFLRDKLKKLNNFKLLHDWYQKQIEELEGYKPISSLAN